MTPTLLGRFQTRLFLAATVGALWTAAITPVLPRPAGMSSAFAYHVTFEALGLMTLLGLGWEVVYHVLQQARWDKDWPSMFALLVVVSEAIPLWYVTHILDVIPGTTRLSSPIVPLYVIHVSTTWVLTWLFMQGPLRVLHVRWRFEGGKILVRPHGRWRRRPSEWPSAATTSAGSGGLAAAATGAAPVPAAEGASLAEGLLCRHGHFGHLADRYCLVCGSAVLPLAGLSQQGPRPPVGVLILADGSMQVLEHDLTVTASGSPGTLGFLPLGDHQRAVAHIRIVGWQPVMSSPVHTMSLALPGGSELRAEPGVPVPLVAGAEVKLGEHQIRYESPHQAGPLPPAPAAVTGQSGPAQAPGLADVTGLAAASWVSVRPGRKTRRAAAIGAATAALIITLMIGFAGQLARGDGGTEQGGTGRGPVPSSGAVSPGTLPLAPGNGPGSTASPEGYTLAAPGPAMRRPRPRRQGPGRTPGPASTSPEPTSSRSPAPAPTGTRTPSPAPTGTPSPSPSPTGTRPPAPGDCPVRVVLGQLTLRVCGPP